MGNASNEVCGLTVNLWNQFNIAKFKTESFLMQCNWLNANIKGEDFSEHFGVLCFFITPVLRFALLPYCRWRDVFGKNIFGTTHFWKNLPAKISFRFCMFAYIVVFHWFIISDAIPHNDKIADVSTGPSKSKSCGLVRETKSNFHSKGNLSTEIYPN